VREHKGFAITKLEGVEDMNAAQRLKEKVVYINRKDAHLPKGGYFIADIIGAEVVDENGAVIGTLKEVFETPANPIYVVKGETEHLIPAVPEFILNTDVEAKRITVHLIQGL
ncbi:MAG: ribosome maturation factor RimM, partial [Oscillospiraceae bacterium]|nr:ribosome maturation factor RimM [Oscillospiraceae bacterium]